MEVEGQVKVLSGVPCEQGRKVGPCSWEEGESLWFGFLEIAKCGIRCGSDLESWKGRRKV